MAQNDELQIKKYKLVPGFAENAIGEKCSPITHIKTVYNGDEPVTETIQNILDDKTQAPEIIIIDLDYRFARDQLTDEGNGYFSCEYHDDRLKQGYIAEFQLRDQSNVHNLTGIRWVGCGPVSDGKVNIYAYSDMDEVSHAFHFIGRLVVYTKFDKLDISPKVSDWNKIAENVYEYTVSTDLSNINKLALLKINRDNIEKFLNNKYATTNTEDGSVSVFTDTPVELDGTLIFINFRFDDSDIITPDKTLDGEYTLEKVQKYAVYGNLIEGDEDDVVEGFVSKHMWDGIVEPEMQYVKDGDFLIFTVNNKLENYEDGNPKNGALYYIMYGKDFKEPGKAVISNNIRGQWNAAQTLYGIVINEYIKVLSIVSFYLDKETQTNLKNANADKDEAIRSYYPSIIRSGFLGETNSFSSDSDFMEVDYSTLMYHGTFHYKYSLLTDGGVLLPTADFKNGCSFKDGIKSIVMNRDPKWNLMHTFDYTHSGYVEGFFGSSITGDQCPVWEFAGLNKDQLTAQLSNPLDGDINVTSYDLDTLIILNIKNKDINNIKSFWGENSENIKYLKYRKNNNGSDGWYSTQTIPYKPLYTTIHINGVYFGVNIIKGYMIVLLTSPDYIKYTSLTQAQQNWELPQNYKNLLSGVVGDIKSAFELRSTYTLDNPTCVKTDVSTEQTYIGHRNGIVLIFDHESMDTMFEFDMKDIISKETPEYSNYTSIKSLDYWDNECIVVSCENNPYIYCINKSTKQVVWKYQTEHSEGVHFVTSNRQTIFFTYRNANNHVRIAEWKLKKIETQQPTTPTEPETPVKENICIGRAENEESSTNHSLCLTAVGNGLDELTEINKIGMVNVSDKLYIGYLDNDMSLIGSLITINGNELSPNWVANLYPKVEYWYFDENINKFSGLTFSDTVNKKTGDIECIFDKVDGIVKINRSFDGADLDSETSSLSEPLYLLRKTTSELYPLSGACKYEHFNINGDNYIVIFGKELVNNTMKYAAIVIKNNSVLCKIYPSYDENSIGTFCYYIAYKDNLFFIIIPSNVKDYQVTDDEYYTLAIDLSGNKIFENVTKLKDTSVSNYEIYFPTGNIIETDPYNGNIMIRLDKDKGSIINLDYITLELNSSRTALLPNKVLNTRVFNVVNNLVLLKMSNDSYDIVMEDGWDDRVGKVNKGGFDGMNKYKLLLESFSANIISKIREKLNVTFYEFSSCKVPSISVGNRIYYAIIPQDDNKLYVTYVTILNQEL